MFTQVSFQLTCTCWGFWWCYDSCFWSSKTSS